MLGFNIWTTVGGTEGAGLVIDVNGERFVLDAVLPEMTEIEASAAALMIGKAFQTYYTEKNKIIKKRLRATIGLIDAEAH
jgi:hypothetical protein